MALKYQGFPKYQTLAERADRMTRDMLGDEAYAEMRDARQEYYRDLLKKIQESK